MEQGKKISELEHLSTLSGGEMIPIIRDGRNYKTSINDVKGLFGAGAALAADMQVGNTTLGDALLQVSNDNELVKQGFLDKTSKVLKAGTPHDLIFGALLYADREAYQPTVVVTQGGFTYNNGGTLVIGSIGSPKPGDEVTFTVTYTPAVFTAKNSSIEITKGYGYSRNAELTDIVYGDSHNIVKNANSAKIDAVLSVTHNGTPLTLVSSSGNVYTYKYTAVAGENKIAASVQQAKYECELDAIQIWPLDERGNLAKAYPSGAKTTGVAKITKTVDSIDNIEKSVTAYHLSYAYYMKKDGTNRSEEVVVDYNGTVPTSAEKANLKTTYPADRFPVYILIPQGQTISKIEVYSWDALNGVYNDKSSVFVFTSDGTESLDDGKTYDRYKCDNSLMGGGDYYITIKL